MNEIKINAPVAKALALVAAGEVTFSYRSAPKIKGTRLVKAVSSEWLNKKIASGVTDSMLAKLYAAELVRDTRSSYGVYTVKLTAKGADALQDSAKPVTDKATADVVINAAVAKAEAVKVEAEVKIHDALMAAAKAAKTQTSKDVLFEAACLVDIREFEEARKVLVPLHTRAALAAIAAIKAL